MTAKTPPKTKPKKSPSAGRRLARKPDSYPQSGAPLPTPIDGAEIVVRVAGMLPRDMRLGEVVELVKGLAWSYGALSVFVSIQPGISAEDFETIRSEVRAAFEDGQRQVSEAQIKSHNKSQKDTPCQTSTAS